MGKNLLKIDILKKSYKVFLLKNIKTFPKRILQLLSIIMSNRSFFLQGKMDIHKNSLWYNPDFHKFSGGFHINNDSVDRLIFDIEPWDIVRRDMIILLLREIVVKNIRGDFAEVGVYKGYTSRLIHNYAPERVFHLFDTFEGFTEKSTANEINNTKTNIDPKQFNDTSVEKVLKFIGSKNNNIITNVGFFPDTISLDHNNLNFSFVSLDADLFQPTYDGLVFFYQRLTVGGFILVHDYNAWKGARKAVDQFCLENKLLPIPMPDKSGSALLRKI